MRVCLNLISPPWLRNRSGRQWTFQRARETLDHDPIWLDHGL